MTAGVLYGVGLGPGDPELITLKAARLIASAPVIAYPTLEGADSFARGIVSSLIGATHTEIAINLPMTTEREPAQRAYDAGAARISEVLSAGHDVVCLCEGDPFFYGSFMHLYERMKDHTPIEIVPAITGMSGAWTATGLPVTWGDDVLTVLVGTLPEDKLIEHMGRSDALVVMKIGRNLDKVSRALKAAGRYDAAWLIEYATMPGQTVSRLAEAEDSVTPYFSIIVVHGQGRRP